MSRIEQIRKNQEKIRSRRVNQIWIVLNLLFAGIYIIWRLFRTIPYQKSIVSDVCWVVLFVVEAVDLISMMIHSYNMYDYDSEYTKIPLVKAAALPVDVLIPTLNEPVELLEKTILACKNLQYPGSSAIHIYVCDDGERDALARLCEKMGVTYLSRDKHDHAKAGNLNYALSCSKSPLVAIFDADMVPDPDFLMKTVPYFSREKKVGFVQAPQSFYEPDLFQWNLFAEDMIPNEQEYFYKVVELSKNKSNSVIFGGSNAVLLRRGLEEIGGFVTGVLTEDFATGIELEKKGYRGIAVNTTAARGKTPDNMASLIRQRCRWARGCIQSGRKTRYLTDSGLSFVQKLNYLISINYWYSCLRTLIYYLAPVLFALFDVIVVECTLPEVILFWVPMYVCSMICISRFSHNIRSVRWTRIYDMVFCPYLLSSVVSEFFGRTKREFLVTDKNNAGGKENSLQYILPYLILGAVDVAAILRLVGRSAIEGTFSYSVVLLWLLINLHTIFMSVLCVWRRKGWYEGDRELSGNLKEKMGMGFRALLLHITE